MDLLFNKNNTGATELKELLGFTDADIKWVQFQPYLITATDLLIDIIGNPIYESLRGIYTAESSSAADAEFLKRVQTVIGLDAYRNLTPYLDLAHTNKGRVNRVEDKEKIAFEWQIVKSDNKMERDYYRALDRLIKYMDKSVSGWKNTDAYKLTHDLFIRTALEIDDYFNIDGSRLLFLKLAPGIRKAEREDILPRITKTRFDQLKEKLKNNAGDHDAILLEKIKEAVVYKSLSWGIPRLSARLFPEGFLELADNSRMTITAKKSVERNQAEAYSQRFKEDADLAFREIEKYIESLNVVPVLPENVPPITPNFNQDDNFVDC